MLHTKKKELIQNAHLSFILSASFSFALILFFRFFILLRPTGREAAFSSGGLAAIVELGAPSTISLQIFLNVYFSRVIRRFLLENVKIKLSK